MYVCLRKKESESNVKKKKKVKSEMTLWIIYPKKSNMILLNKKYSC